MRYKVLPAALVDLSGIEAYVASNFGIVKAEEVHAKFFEIFELLAKFPLIGHVRSDVTRKPVRFFSDGHNWIIYKPGKPLEIQRIHPARMKLRRF